MLQKEIMSRLMEKVSELETKVEVDAKDRFFEKHEVHEGQGCRRVMKKWKVSPTVVTPAKAPAENDDTIDMSAALHMLHIMGA